MSKKFKNHPFLQKTHPLIHENETAGRARAKTEKAVRQHFHKLHELHELILKKNRQVQRDAHTEKLRRTGGMPHVEAADSYDVRNATDEELEIILRYDFSTCLPDKCGFFGNGDEKPVVTRGMVSFNQLLIFLHKRILS